MEIIKKRKDMVKYLMKKLIISILTIIILLSSTSFSFSEKELFLNNIKEEIFNEIEETKDKVLIVDKIIGDRYVKYWQHIIDAVLVKNDSILLNINPETGEILEYTRVWTDIKLDDLKIEDNILTVKDYLWKKKVVFPDQADSSLFYTFYHTVEYPVVCWEVRYGDGTIILYDPNGIKIGNGVPTPRTEGVVIKGHGEPDWYLWKDNAQEWFHKWCDSLQSQSSPDLSWISDRVSDPDLEYFYVIAHSDGQPDRFLAKEGVYYNATRLHNDMSSRSPIKLAVLCCCSAMENTGPNTLSYEFRKGIMDDTVTIGYFDMGNCSGWPSEVYNWQDDMFRIMDKGYRMKIAFDISCALHPTVADHVRFVGDTSLKVESTVLISSDTTTTQNLVEIETNISSTSQSAQSITVKEEADKLLLQKIILNKNLLYILIEFLRKI